MGSPINFPLHLWLWKRIFGYFKLNKFHIVEDFSHGKPVSSGNFFKKEKQYIANKYSFHKFSLRFGTIQERENKKLSITTNQRSRTLHWKSTKILSRKNFLKSGPFIHFSERFHDFYLFCFSLVVILFPLPTWGRAYEWSLFTMHYYFSVLKNWPLTYLSNSLNSGNTSICYEFKFCPPAVRFLSHHDCGPTLHLVRVIKRDVTSLLIFWTIMEYYTKEVKQ